MQQVFARRSALGWVALAALVIVLVIAIRTFVMTQGDLSKRRSQVAEAWTELDGDIRARAGMLPEAVTLLRTKPGNAAPGAERVAAMLVEDGQAIAKGLTPEESMRANTALDNAIGRFMILADDEPGLRDTKALATLELQLEGAENRILKSRQKYNLALHDYNVQLQQFPQNAVAALSGFQYNDAYFTTNVTARR